MFSHLTPYAGDPILSLVEAFSQDPRSDKTNLAIGVYCDENGRLVLPEAVRRAAEALPAAALSYAPMEGYAAFRQAAAQMLFGSGHAVIREGRLATAQTLGGSGALKLGADLLRETLSDARAYVSDPTWDNHRGIFAGAGFSVADYPYYRAETAELDFAALTAFLDTLPAHSVVLLHPCCHNPTGIDPTPAQWDEILDLMARRRLIAFMDIAYQGFGSGFDDDAYAVRRAADIGLPLLVSYSFSKNMSLYAQRVGLLAVVCPDRAQAELVQGRLKAAVRRIYSSPPAYGALLAQAVLTDDALKRQWQDEVAAMRGRIGAMRQALYDALAGNAAWQQDAARFVRQRGMFGYTGLNAEQVQRLRRDYGIYLPASGRLCIAGLNPDNLENTAAALKAVKAA